MFRGNNSFFLSVRRLKIRKNKIDSNNLRTVLSSYKVFLFISIYAHKTFMSEMV